MNGKNEWPLAMVSGGGGCGVLSTVEMKLASPSRNIGGKIFSLSPALVAGFDEDVVEEACDPVLGPLLSNFGSVAECLRRFCQEHGFE